MKKILLALLVSFSLNVVASDWQYAGASKNGNNKDEDLFYDAEKVLVSNNTVKFWIKTIEHSKIINLVNSASKEVVETSATKLVNGYIPKIMQTSFYKKNLKNKNEYEMLLTNIVAYEYFANNSKLPNRAVVYYELDCKNKTLKPLTINTFDKNDNLVSSTSSHQVTDISPDSTGESWNEMFCKN